MSVADAIKYLKKEMKEALEFDSDLKGITTGSIALDQITGIGGFPLGRVSEIFGWEGCLSSDTFIHYTIVSPTGKVQNCKGGTIERLYDRFHKIPMFGRGSYQRQATIDSSFYVPSVNEEDRIFLNRVVDVIASGTRPCYTITTETGEVITATGEHKFYNGDQYVELQYLTVGDVVMIHNNTPFSDGKGRQRRGDEIFVKFHPYAREKVIDGKYLYHRLYRYRAIVEAEMNGLTLVDFIQRLNLNQIADLQFLSPDFEIHHKDENRQNNAIENLQIIKHSPHARLHALKDHNNLRFVVVKDRISNIQYVGEKRTFDIMMEGPHHNFVANRFAVHNSGKTTVLLSACAQAQRRGKYVAYLDAERGVDLEHATRLGFNWKDETKGLYATPFCSEEAFIMVDKLAESGGCDLICVDSIPGLVPRKIMEGEMDETGGIGLASRLLASFLARITKTIATNKVALVFANQMRARIATSWADRGPTEQAAGGSAIKFYTSLRLDVTKGKVLKEKRLDPMGSDTAMVEMPIGNVHYARAFKNKVAVPNRECEFFIKYDPKHNIYGIDNIQTIMEMAKDKNFIRTAGGTVIYESEIASNSIKTAGFEEFRTILLKNPEAYKELRAKIGVPLSQ